MEINQSATELLLKGTVVTACRTGTMAEQPVRFIDFEHPGNNDFLVINQFKVELTSGRGHIIPTLCCSSTASRWSSPSSRARASRTRCKRRSTSSSATRTSGGRCGPTLYSENEGVERLFHTNQLLMASDFFEARAAILRRFKDDWDALERELRKFVEELRRGDRIDFPGLDPRVQVPFVRLMLEFCSAGQELDGPRRNAVVGATLDMVDRIRQEVRKVGFWKPPGSIANY